MFEVLHNGRRVALCNSRSLAESYLKENTEYTLKEINNA